MKALSIRQPWAWLIVNGHKDVENRAWHTGFQGPLLIHAGKQRDGTREEWEDVSESIYDDLGVTIPDHDKAELGGIVGSAFMTGCGPSSQCTSLWNSGAGWCFKLSFGRAARAFLPYRGALGFFDVPDEVAREALGEERFAALAEIARRST